jgi:hypothetical protein
VQIAEDYVGESLTPSTVVAALTLAADLKLERLKACCCDFVAQHAQAVRASHTLHALSAATLKVRRPPPSPRPRPLALPLPPRPRSPTTSASAGAAGP